MNYLKRSLIALLILTSLETVYGAYTHQPYLEATAALFAFVTMVVLLWVAFPAPGKQWW